MIKTLSVVVMIALTPTICKSQDGDAIANGFIAGFEVGAQIAERQLAEIEKAKADAALIVSENNSTYECRPQTTNVSVENVNRKRRALFDGLIVVYRSLAFEGWTFDMYVDGKHVERANLSIYSPEAIGRYGNCEFLVTNNFRETGWLIKSRTHIGFSVVTRDW